MFNYMHFNSDGKPFLSSDSNVAHPYRGRNEMLYLAVTINFLLSIILTPLIIKLAYKIGALDTANHRKEHVSVMPRIGGLARRNL